MNQLDRRVSALEAAAPATCAASLHHRWRIEYPVGFENQKETPESPTCPTCGSARPTVVIEYVDGNAWRESC